MAYAQHSHVLVKSTALTLDARLSFIDSTISLFVRFSTLAYHKVWDTSQTLSIQSRAVPYAASNSRLKSLQPAPKRPDLPKHLHSHHQP
jgi:hypothetical protein